VFESQTLYELACLQAGLPGEAWKSLAPMWGMAQAGKTLIRLQRGPRRCSCATAASSAGS
jgi:hypothetical protein